MADVEKSTPDALFKQTAVRPGSRANLEAGQWAGPKELKRQAQQSATQAETQQEGTRGERQQAKIQRAERDARRAAVADVQQMAVDDLYGVVRTLRGWARSSATAGDSRELQVALEETLNLVDAYAKFPVDRRCGVPDDYNRSSLDWQTSPLRQEASSGRDYAAVHEPWVLWVPPPCPHDPDSKDVKESMEYNGRADEPKNKEDAKAVRLALARIWVANEVGRSMVRAVEFATTTKTLLDRDRARLLLSLEKAARRFLAQQDFRSAGVLVAYLVELGLGARRCPADEVDWHFEPLARLVVLNREFWDRQLVRDAQDFSMGTAAAVIKVAEAIAEARLGEHFDRQSGRAWDGSVEFAITP